MFYTQNVWLLEKINVGFNLFVCRQQFYFLSGFFTMCSFFFSFFLSCVPCSSCRNMSSDLDFSFVLRRFRSPLVSYVLLVDKVLRSCWATVFPSGTVSFLNSQISSECYHKCVRSWKQWRYFIMQNWLFRERFVQIDWFFSQVLVTRHRSCCWRAFTPTICRVTITYWEAFYLISETHHWRLQHACIWDQVCADDWWAADGF